MDNEDEFKSNIPLPQSGETYLRKVANDRIMDDG